MGIFIDFLMIFLLQFNLHILNNQPILIRYVWLRLMGLRPYPRKIKINK